MAPGSFLRHVRPLACLLSTTALFAACANGSNSNLDEDSSGSDGSSGSGSQVSCGDGVKAASEQCDGNDFGGKSCADVLGDETASGPLSCTASCTLDTSKCVSAKCGDGVKNSDAEQCDGNDLNGATCKSVLANTHATGTLKCNSACRFDEGGCSVPDYCGDGILNGTEQCDGTIFSPGATCVLLVGFGSTGKLACTPNCTYDTSSCSAPVTCGNGKIDADEECDGTLLNNKTCATVLNNVHAIGTLKCSSTCVLDPSGCSIEPYCGDGKLQAGEECDDGNANNNDRCSNSCKTICKGNEVKWSSNGHCYIDADFTSYSNKTWDAAQALCVSAYGGHLVTITSQAEFSFVYNNVMPGSWDAYSTAPRWIGLNDKAVEGTFVWVTGEPVLVTAWESGEPNNSGGNEDCVEMKWSGGGWNDLDCSKTRPFICEIEPEVLYP